MRETAYKTLERIALVEDDGHRRVALREALLENNNLAIIVQRCYHPNYNFSLPLGPLPDNVARKSHHDEAGPFYTSLRKWDVFRIPEEIPANANIKKHVIESQFIDLYEAISTGDAELLIGIKDKKLPWDTLNATFVVNAVPELFPPSFRPSETGRVIQTVLVPKSENIPVTTLITQADALDEFKPEPIVGSSKKDTCRKIMENNPGLARKDYLKLFEAQGVSLATGGLYYQELKKKIAA